jgi:predicted nucleic acid-binding protein
MYLLDTNVVSDSQKGAEKPLRWLASIDPHDGYLSVITLGEVEKGIVKLKARDPAHSARIAVWLAKIRNDNAGRIFPVTEENALLWGRLAAGRTRGDADGLIAATALVHDLIVVTRNVADFDDTGVAVLNPWAD